MRKIGNLTLYTVQELAELLDVQERTIREYLKSDKLRGRKLANRWYVTEAALKDYFDGQGQSQNQEDEAGSRPS